MKRVAKVLFFTSAIFLLGVTAVGAYEVAMIDEWDSSDYLLAIFASAVVTNLFKVFAEE